MSLFTMIAFSFLCAILYYVVPLRLRWMLLLAVSYGYYAYCGMRALPFILLTTLSTWAGALVIGRIGESAKAELKARKAELDAAGKKALKQKAKNRQRVLFWGVLLLNFGILALLKYTNPVLEAAGRPALHLIVPLGISFYTFQSMGYLIDVSNGKYPAERNPFRFALFVSFFPQLIQGPIARYDDLGTQLKAEHRFDLEAIERGALLLLWGFFKMKVIADRALPLVSEVFANYGEYGGAVIVVGVLFYSLQQYCDFSGGIDLVAGIAELFGIRLAPNFKRPYFSVSLGDFWRRWHISLGAWMRDYVFYPFALTKPVTNLSKAAKKRFGADFARALPAALGNIVVFLLVGVWHGASSNYIFWGLYNGLILAMSALLEPVYKRTNERLGPVVHTRGFYCWRVLRTFIIVNIGWYFDRSAHALDAVRMMGRTLFVPMLSQLTNGTLLALGLSSTDFMLLFVATVLLITVSVLQERGMKIRETVLSLPLPARIAVLYIFMLFVLAAFTGDSAANVGFMYANF